MGFQTGSNNGISGLIGLTGTPKFPAKVYAWQELLSGSTLLLAGRGQGAWPGTLFLVPSGNLTIIAEPDPSNLAAPIPTIWAEQTGSIAIQYHQYVDGNGVTKTARQVVPVKVVSFQPNYDATKNDRWKITIACSITGQPTFEDFPGGQPTGTALASGECNLYEGMQTIVDPGGLQSSAARRWAVWPVSDTDADDVSTITTILAKALPAAGLKKRTATAARASSSVVIVSVAYGLTDTAEDWVNPRTSIKTDPGKMQTSGTVAAINAAPVLPTIAGQSVVDRGTTETELNDGHIGKVTEFGQRSTQEDVSMEGTQARIDKDGLASEGQDVTVFPHAGPEPADATPPDASLKVVGTLIQAINRDEKKKVTYFDVNGEAEKRIFARAKADVDPSLLKDVTIKGAVHTTGSIPDAPGATGLVLRSTLTIPLVSPDTSNKSVTFWEYGQTTSADDAIFPHAKTTTDPRNIETTKLSAELVTTGAAVGAGSPPAGLKTAECLDIPLTDALASNKSLRVWRYEKLDSLDKLRLPKQKTTIDANALAGDAVRTKEWLSDAVAPTVPDDPPGSDDNVKFITYTDLAVYPAIGATPGLNLRVFLYGTKDSKDEQVLPHTETTTDSSGLESTAIRAYLNGDAVPATPDGLVLRDTKVKPLTDGLTASRTLTVLVFGKRTRAQDLTYPKIQTKTDYSKAATLASIDDSAIRCEIWETDSTPPAAPTDAPANNVKLIGVTDLPITPTLGTVKGQNLRVFVYGARSSEDQLLLPNIETTTDAAALDGQAVRAYFTGQSAPATPDGFVLRDTKVRPITLELGVNRELNILIYGKKTREQDLTYPKTETTTDYNGATTALIDDSAIRCKLWAVGGTAPTAPDSPPTNNVKLLAVTDLPVTPTNGTVTGQNLRVFVYGSRSSSDKLILPNYETNADQSALESTAIRAYFEGGTEPEPPASPYVHRFTKTIPVTLGLETNKTLLVKVYGITSTEQDITLPGSPYAFAATEGMEKTVTTLASTTSDAATYGAALLADTTGGGLFADPTLARLEVVKRTAGKAIVRKTYAGDDMKQRYASPRAFYDQVRATGTPQAEAAYVHVESDFVAIGPVTVTQFIVIYSVVMRKTHGFILRRRIACTPSEVEGLLFDAKRGCVNDAAFRGHGQYLLMYEGAELVYLGEDAGDHVAVIDYHFKYDSLGHPNENRIPFGRVTGDGIPAGASGYSVLASTAIRSNAIMLWPTPASFSDFVGTLPVPPP
jgi:hypothetical protein